ncbi:hypothetical protein PIB30_099172 [Stylosanthes scabra]|uniref:Uncharacterized protein n=1 Tax=Stylosanthes scabra TaxID=79078 RepID=A0ABU6YUF4_9FABA|nr:hypothetical protein [Stylosanthes scabra]
MAAPAANSLDLNNSPSVDEEAVIALDQSDIRGVVDRCSKSLIGRLSADRPFSVGTIEAALQSIWRQLDGFKIIDHGGRRLSQRFQQTPQTCPLNLIKSLASLSMNSQNLVSTREESEVASKAKQPVTSPATSLAPNLQLPNAMITNDPSQDFVFATTTEASQSTTSCLSLKKQARKKFKRIACVKRNPITVSEPHICKKICSNNNYAAKEGKGATPQWAPSDP